MPVFTANVPGVLKVGDKIEIGGKIRENARKMSVNLCAQEGEEPRDVVLHFDVRFHRDNIISLSRKNGIWIGSGNYDTNYNMFVPGTIFKIVFEIKDTDVITIYCQGKFHSNFLPKIPLSMAKYIVAWADVERITHCYFHFCNKQQGIGEEASPVMSYGPTSPRATVPNVGGDAKRWKSSRSSENKDIIRHVVPIVPHSKYRPSGSVIQHASVGVHALHYSPRMAKKVQGTRSEDESSDEETKMERLKENRADRYFYETMMCPQAEPVFPSDRRRVDMIRVRQEHNRKYNGDTETEKFNTEDSEDVTKNDSSIDESEDILTDMKAHRRKYTPFAQVVSLMGKNGRRN